ncbi:MAG: Crp/Fnr family transcriptional regulator [Dehalococcoidales bacterium]|nr:MAG: Crp/Fnr family transcriptional regulator [Dehalococcoidales bacterium]
MAVNREFLESIPYFIGLDSAELSSVGQFFSERKVERGEIIQLEGESARELYFVASGAIKVFKTSAEGKEQILSIIRPGEAFNDIAIFDGEPSPVSAQAMTPVTLYGIGQSELHTLLREYPRLSLNTTSVLAKRTRQLMALVEDLSFRNVISRVARVLLENAGNGTAPGARLTQQEMAAMVGSVREVVARSLKALEAEGAIRLERHRIRIMDKEALEAIV